MNKLFKILNAFENFLKFQKSLGVNDLKNDYEDKSKETLMKELRMLIGDCTRCKLHKNRKNLVFGTGNINSELVFVGEAPGADEDIQGEPFVGEAGKLLTKIIKAMGYERKEVYIANIIKCRPPNNRNPEQDEIKTCEPFLVKQ